MNQTVIGLSIRWVILKPARARDKLRHWFRQQDRSKNLEVGREILNKELARLAIHPKVLI